MATFIELHEGPKSKIPTLINIDNIVNLGVNKDGYVEIYFNVSHGDKVDTMRVAESYDEVKEIIAKAQGINQDDTIIKPL